MCWLSSLTLASLESDLTLGVGWETLRAPVVGEMLGALMSFLTSGSGVLTFALLTTLLGDLISGLMPLGDLISGLMPLGDQWSLTCVKLRMAAFACSASGYPPGMAVPAHPTPSW